MRRNTSLRRCRDATSLASVESLEPRLFLSAPELTDTTPWGVGSSAEAGGYSGTFIPKMAQAGIKWIRTGFDFGGVEPSQGTWNWASYDNWVNTTTANGMYSSGLLLGTPSWINSNGSYFPTNNLPAWGTFVSAVVNRYKDRIAYWEIWNEPENFASNGTPAQYASIVTAAYDAIKAADPTAKVGMSVASVDVPYLEQAILAGAKDHFDYIVVHPYEMFGTMDSGQEAEYMSIVPTIHKMLAADNPALANAPVWVTEIGTTTGGTTTQKNVAAQQLIKGYTMGIAQGFAHIEWFDAMGADPYNMGLLSSTGAILPAYTAYKNMITELGPNPQYLGWVQLNGRDYGFVFQGATTTVLVTWAPPGVTDTVNFGSTVSIMNPVTGATSNASSYSLTGAPIFVRGVPLNIVAAAKFNKTLAFTWGGDYTGASSVSVNLGATNTEAGLHQLNANSSSTGVILDGTTSARDCSISGGQAFTVDPNFLSYSSASIRITVVVRRKSGTGTVPGFNLKYESPTGRAGGPSWYNVPYNSASPNQWYTQTYTLTNDRFVGNWAYNFSFDSDSTTYSAYYMRSVTVTNLSSTSNAPTSVSLAPASDSGISGDNLTSFNNSTDTRKLSFSVLGTTSGARVYVYAGATLMGSAIAGGTTTLITTDGFSLLGDGNYNLTAKQVTDPKLLSLASPSMPLKINTVPPVVSGIVVNDGNAQRSMVKSITYAFSSAVTPSGSAFTLTRRSDGLVVPVTLSSVNGIAYVLSFGGSSIVRGSLADGVYDLVLHTGQVQDAFGQTLAGGDQTLSFFRLYGDYDGNGMVNNTDLFWLKRTFGMATGSADYLWFMDYDGNGKVNNTDLFWFKANFGKSMTL